ncbi:MAG TPA: amino acid adenylation domain-containing protein [Mycobacteriales bacterium]|nr:amino acid adenylation domain-containing protein [Mycobacteriales bacterium]
MRPSPLEALPAGWNDTATVYERDCSIHDVWAQRVAETPDAIAIEDAHRRLTYAELDAAAADLAGRLVGDLEGEEPCVGVLADRSIEVVVAIIAAIKAGAAYVPLDPHLPLARLELMVEDTAIGVVLAQPAHRERARLLVDTVIDTVIDLDAPPGASRGATPEVRSVGPRALVYVMYTSGTSGRPKGVAIEHRGVLRYVRGAPELMPRPGEGMLFVNQLGFDGSTYEIWGALLNGARLVVHVGAPTPHAIARTMIEHAVTVSLLPTGLFHQLVDWAGSAQPGASDVAAALAALRLVLPAGDVLSPSHARRFLALTPGSRLVNAYGPTEATVTGSIHEVTDVVDGESVPIGRPLPNTTLHVLDDELRPVAPGTRGELYIGGDGVARGYLNRPDLTADRFVDDPFTDGGRLYRTGDLVRMRADANLEYLGRIDDQVKIRGYRVEPAEVEAILNTHPSVRQAIVVVREDVPGHKRLVAYVTADDLPAGDLQAFAAVHLPSYLVPSAIVHLDELPLTANGKPDRLALPAPGSAGAGDAPGRAPRAGTERAVADAIEAVLRCGALAATSDFFALGGDSLLAIQVLSRLQADLGAALPMDVVFRGRTVEAIAAGADELLASGAVALRLPPLPPLPAPAAGAPEPVSISQSMALFHTELADAAMPYQSQAVIWFDGPLDPALLERALTAVVARHEILRTAFERRPDGWVQVVHPPTPVVLPVVDLRSQPDVDAAFAALTADRFGRRIDLTRPPIAQWTLAVVADERWALLQVEHHVIHDGASFATLLGETAATYRALVDGTPVVLTEPVQYRQFARWQRELVTSDAGRRQLQHWTDRLAQLPPAPDLVVDREHLPTPTYRGASLSRELTPEQAEALRRVAAELGATPYMVMLAAFFALLHRCSGQRDIVVGSGLAARRLPELSEMVGMAVNTVALRVDVAPDATARELVEVVRRCCLEAQENQELPFEELVRRLAPPRHGGQSAIYRHLFSFHDAPLPDLAMGDVRVRADDVQSNHSATADINVVVVNRRSAEDPRRGALRVVWEYSSDLFDAASADRMLNQYIRLLEEIVGNASQPVGCLPMTAPGERDALISASSSVRPYERDASVHEVFRRRVAERRDSVAVTSATGTLTYGELDAAARAVAQRLIAEGLRAGDRVAVVDDRTPAMVAALLGVLRAGGAYVGVDRVQPAARVQALLEAAQVRLACASDGAPVPGAATTIATAGLLGASDRAVADVPVAATDLAYVSFTSGSTGEPKGVAVRHRSVVRLVRGTDYVELGPEGSVLAAAPLAFDASTFEIWGALLNGARLVLAPPGPRSTAETAALLRGERVSVAWFTAAFFHQMVDHELDALCGVRQILAGGDVLSPVHVNRLLAALPEGAVLINGYGPTEATTFTCCHRMPAGTSVGPRVPIGRPIANSSAYLVDAGGAPVPVGVVGEIWAGGDGVAAGYVGRPDLDTASFLSDPFTTTSPGRAYRTGDLARRRPDGTIELLGRSDRQTKVRGHRVEPAEAEAMLLRCLEVRQAHVEVVERGPDDRALVAYLVGDGARPPDIVLRRTLRSHLPGYLMPSAFVWLDELPVTANGKLDRAALPPAPSTWFDADRPDDPASTVERTVTSGSKNERALLAIWQEVLGVRHVGLDDDFFDLGGHSLLAVTLVIAIERTIGARLPLSMIFSAPTVRQMAAVLRSEGWDAPWGSLVTLQAHGTRPPLFAVTAGDGNVVGFAPLARRLGTDQPFYVLQPHGLDGRALLHRTVEAMARRYVREIRRVQPRGPYLLAGRCFGALVAVEMAIRLEALGEEVALLIAIDSIGPLWRPRRLANGMPYDEVMNLAVTRAAEGGVSFDAAFADAAVADELVAWLREPVSKDADAAVSRYLHAAYTARADLRAAYPLDAAGGHRGLVDWAWVGGRSEMGMNPDLLTTPSEWALRAQPSVDPRRTSRGRRARERFLDLADLATRGTITRLAERRRDRVLALAAENVLDYRAAAFRAPVVLIRSEDDEDDVQKAQLARWYGLESGGVTVRYSAGSHHSMLREPDVGSLAACVEESITAVIA